MGSRTWGRLKTSWEKTRCLGVQQQHGGAWWGCWEWLNKTGRKSRGGGVTPLTNTGSWGWLTGHGVFPGEVFPLPRTGTGCGGVRAGCGEGLEPPGRGNKAGRAEVCARRDAGPGSGGCVLSRCSAGSVCLAAAANLVCCWGLPGPGRCLRLATEKGGESRGIAGCGGHTTRAECGVRAAWNCGEAQAESRWQFVSIAAPRVAVPFGGAAAVFPAGPLTALAAALAATPAAVPPSGSRMHLPDLYAPAAVSLATA